MGITSDTIYTSFDSLSAIPLNDRVVDKVYKIHHPEVKLPIEVI